MDDIQKKIIENAGDSILNTAREFAATLSGDTDKIQLMVQRNMERCGAPADLLKHLVMARTVIGACCGDMLLDSGIQEEVVLDMVDRIAFSELRYVEETKPWEAYFKAAFDDIVMELLDLDTECDPDNPKHVYDKQLIAHSVCRFLVNVQAVILKRDRT